MRFLAAVNTFQFIEQDPRFTYPRGPQVQFDTYNRVLDPTQWQIWQEMEWPTILARLVMLVPLAVVAVDFILRIVQNRIGRKGPSLPPGPTPLPLIGNTLSIDAQTPWLTYTNWRAKYGDIMYLRLLDSDVIVLNSHTAATDLLEKRSNIYSDRPFIATVDPFGHDCDFGFARYGDHWKLCRQIFHQTFRNEASVAFHPMQLRRARQIVMNVVDDPDNYPSHFRTFSAGVGMSAVYDYEPSPRNDPMVSTMDTFMLISLPELTPEKSVILRAFPFLLHIPDWMPGSGIKRRAKESYAWSKKMLNSPYQYVQKRMESKGDMSVAMVPDHINRMEELDDASRPAYEKALKDSAATALMGSSGTTTSALMTFTFCMVKNPHAWKRAQVEIDSVVGTDRLPEFGDRPSLPYVEAIMRETMRWGPVGPTGAPHVVTTSDVYMNYYIPKGATVIANIWGMSRDEVRYPDAEKFMPERFLDGEGTLTNDDPADFVFGFGRRICPGRFVADASMWSAFATMLATLEFRCATDADGNEITFTPTFINGLSRHPAPFPCRLIPRAHVNKQVLEQILS